MLLKLTWFRNSRSKGGSRRFSCRTRCNPVIQRLEDRTLLSGWSQLNGNAQHTGDSTAVAQPLDHVLYSVPLDWEPWGAEHYGSPVFVPGNTVIVPVKVTSSGQDQNAANFFVEALNLLNGQVLWTSTPIGTIYGITDIPGYPLVIDTVSLNSLVTGDSVSIGGVQGVPAANGTFTITVLNNEQFELNGTTGDGAVYTSGGNWALNSILNRGNITNYIEPPDNWLPPFQPVYDPVNDRLYYPGPGGTVDVISHPELAAPGGVPLVGVDSFYPYSTFNVPEDNASIFVNTGLTVDNQGNVYFGYTVTGTNSAGLTDGGIARISATGAVTYTPAYQAVGQPNDGNWNPALGASPAISNDGSTVYIGINDSGYGLNGNEFDSYLVAFNSTTLAPENAVQLIDPSSGDPAGLIDESTSSPMVAPDGTVFQGVFGNPYNGSRGYLLHFSADLSTEFTPGAFGWDDTPSIVPTSMVPSYTGSSPYLILSKYNNYANADFGGPNSGDNGGNGVNEIAVLDPYSSVPDPNNDPNNPNPGYPNANFQVMATVEAFASPSPDEDAVNAGDPDAVREWCTNSTVVDPATNSVFMNNEDGYTYEWNLATDTITNAVEVTTGIGVPYTPTAIAYNGEIFSDNGGTLFAEGGYSNDTITTTSSADPTVVGNPITLTTTLASTNGGPVPTGTITFSYTEGANNPFNSTPITIGTEPLVGGVASIPVSGWVAAHYHIVASYSGDSKYPAGQSTLVQAVLETATTTVSASSDPITVGNGVTLTATVAPNGSSFVPIGTVTFMDGNTVLGTASLNNLDNEADPPSDNTASLTVPSLPGGTDAITAVYSGDLNFSGGTSAIFDEYVATLANPGTQNSAVSDSVSLQVNASGLPPGDTWTYSASGLPSGLSINSSTGLITGTITGSASNYSATVTASDGQGDNPSQTLTWNVSQLAVTNPGTLQNAVGDTVSFQTQDSGLPSGDSWSYSALSLLPGLSINASTGLVSGTITGSAHEYVLSITASDGQGASATQIFEWNVSQLSVTNPVEKSNAVGDNRFTYQVQASGLPPGDSWTYSATGLPSGLSINSSTGQVTGTVTGSANDYSTTVTASDGAGASASQTFPWNISQLMLSNPGTLNSAVGDEVGVSFSYNGLPNGYTWGFSATGLPLGVYEGQGVAVILGTITGSAATYTTSVTGGDLHGASVTQTFTWNVSVLSVTNPGTQNNAVGDSVSLQVQDSGLPSGDSWNYSASLPTGLSINPTTGLISGTITGSAKTYAASVTANDGVGASQTQNFTWNVSAPSVANPGTQNSAVGDIVSLQIQDSGLPSGDSWSYSATGLPAGLSINAGTGLITGTITGSANNYAASVTASDGQGASATQGFTWNVSQLSLSPATQYSAVGDTVALQIQDSGLPSGDAWSYTATGLPAGLSINAGTGLITGTITGSANNYAASVTASDGQGASATQGFNWNVSQLSLANPGTQNGAVGDTVSLQTQDSGLPSGDAWSYSAVGLPAGLSINANTGLVTGTITGSANTYAASVTASDGQGASASQGFTWNVSAPFVTNPGSQNSAVGDTVSLQIQDGGLPSGDSWSYIATGLPSGLSISVSSGLISGTITGSAKAYSASVTAGDGQGATATQAFTWNVSQLSVTNPGSQNSAVGDTVSLQVQNSGLPSGDSWSYSANGLPAGLSINASTGLVSGTITGSAIPYSASVTASDGHGASATQSFTWNVSPLSVTNPGTQNSAVGDAVSLQIQDSGLPSGDSWSYSANGLPAGLSINASSGLISGTITGSANAYSASATAGDGQGASATQSFTWNVSVLSVTNPGTQNKAVGDSVSLQVQDGGLPAGDSWSYSASGLPSGLSINASTGLITGTITGSANTYSASVTASDGHGASAAQGFTWNVSQLAVTNPGTQNNAVGDTVSLQIGESGLPGGDAWTYSASLPSGLTINASTGLISGTITGSANAYSASVTAGDGRGASAAQSFTWNVSQLSVTNPGTQTSAVGASVSLQIQAAGLPSGDSWSYTATGLPSGLSISASTGLITGKISGSPATYSPTVTAADGKGGSASQSFTWNVNPTTTTLTSSVDPSDYGQKVTFTATVAAVLTGSSKPTGSVKFLEGSTVLSTVTLSSADKATYTTSAFALPVGGDPITAVYSGSSTFATSTSAVLTQTVNADPTTTTIKSSAATAVVGQQITLTATVAAAGPGSGTPTGTVTFFAGNTQIGQATLSSGKATFPTTSLALGANSITATYNGSGNYQPSPSGSTTVTVNQAKTKTVVATSHNPSTFGQSVTFTATVTVTSPGSGTPTTGTVEFKDGSNVIGSGTLNAAGQATFTTSKLAVGSHSISAVFQGDADFATSTSAAITQKVQNAPSSVTPGDETSASSPTVSSQNVTSAANEDPSVLEGVHPAATADQAFAANSDENDDGAAWLLTT